MKKILNKKFLIGFLFIFVFGMILISSNTLKVRAAAGTTVDVSVSAASTSLSYPNSGTTISWSSNGDSCTFNGNSYGGTANGVSTGSLPVGSNTLTVSCTKADAPIVCNSFYTPLTTCFTADTMVLMSDGTSKKIQDVKIGDIIKGEKTNNTVLGFHQPELDGKLYSFNGGRYFVTEEHPFKTTNGWKSINPKKTEKENIGITVTALKVGDTLITEDGYVLLKSLKGKEGKKDTQLYNFKLDGDHTYYADGYLVHNKTACGGGYTCGANQVCLGDYGHCGITAGSKVVGSVGYYGETPGPYEGMLCSSVAGTQDECNAGWITHGCHWVSAGATCAPCPGNCPAGYSASCSGSQTYCVENQPCVGVPVI